MKHFSKVFVLLAFAVLALGCGKAPQKIDNGGIVAPASTSEEGTVVIEPDAPVVEAGNNEDAAGVIVIETEPTPAPLDDEVPESAKNDTESEEVEGEEFAPAPVTVDPAAVPVVDNSDPEPVPVPEDDPIPVVPAAE